MRKKFTPFLLMAGAVLMAASAQAAPRLSQLSATDLRSSKTPSEMVINGKSLKSLPEGKRAERKAPMKQAPLTDIIYDAPGKPANYLKTTGCFIVYYYDVADYSSTIYWDDNGDVYFLDIISVFVTESFVKGTYSDNTITLPMNQTVYYEEAEGFGLNLGVFQTVYFDYEGNPVDNIYDAEYYDMELRTDIESVTYQVAEDGTVTLQLPGEETEYLLGYYYTDYEEFGYVTDYIFEYMQIFNPVKDEAITIPEDAQINTFAYIANENTGLIADVALYDYDELYIRGLCEQYPEATLKAFVEEEAPYLAVVPNGQLVGMTFDRKFIYTAVGKINPDYDPDDYFSLPVLPAPNSQYTLRLSYDENHNISGISAYDDSLVLVFNASENDFDPIDWFEALKLTPQNSFAGTPREATNLYYNTNLVSILGFNNFSFDLSNISTEGNVLMPANLSYSIYIDDEPLVFEEEYGIDLAGNEDVQYAGVTSPTEWLPYTFQNDWDVYKRVGQPYEIGIYIDGVTTIGVELRYVYDDITTYSGVVTLDIENGTVTGVEGITSSATTVSSEYFTIDGLRTSNPSTGMYIKKSTLSDGQIVTSKIIRR